MEHIVIVGNGISGVTAARHIRKNSDHHITIISSESKYFFSRTALMYVYMGHMKFEQTQPYEDWFWEKNRIKLKMAHVRSIHHATKEIIFSDGEKMSYDKLILAVGSKPNVFGWPGQDLEGVQGLYSKQNLEYIEQYTVNKEVCRRAVIVGGGLIGVELAEMLLSRQIPVTFLVREQSFWDNVLPDHNSNLISKHIESHHIDLRLGVNLKEILSNKQGMVRAVVIEETGEEISCDFVGLTPGVSPNTSFLNGSGIALGKGILVNRFLETNIKDIYAIGDCAEQTQPVARRRPIEAVWYSGRMMGETVAQTICGNRMEYRPGHWFNSAKFLDIEYQTYGWVHSTSSKPDYEEHFHWNHEDETKFLTIAYHKDSKEFLGINTFGIRMRHEVFDRWLTEKRSVDHIIDHLSNANFDPEFFRKFEKDIQKAYKPLKETPAQ
jgi:NAD(P)H-nitrite reductase large subunit